MFAARKPLILEPGYKMFVVVVTSGQVKDRLGQVATCEGAKFIVTIPDAGHFVEASSVLFAGEPVAHAKGFETREEAAEFGKRWRGHPWWCKPKGFQILEVNPRYRQVFDGYDWA